MAAAYRRACKAAAIIMIIMIIMVIMVIMVILHCRDATGTSRYSFVWSSPLAWLNSLSLVNNNGYYLTTAQKTKDNVFFNGTNVYPISFALAGAGMIAYAGELPENTFATVAARH